MTKVRISLLGLVFLGAFFYQPNWVYENFWSNADFYDSKPFTLPYLVFLFIYAVITTAIAELGIRFIKEYV
jgi:hypothetical protein